MDAALVSRELFGRPCRLALLVWILKNEKGRFFQSEPPREIAPLSAVRDELNRFVRVGLLDEVRPDGENRVYYLVTRHPLWQVIRTANEVLEAELE